MRRVLIVDSLAVAALLVPLTIHAQQYPAKPIRLVVAQAAGSTTDGLARLVGHELARVLQQQVVIDVRPGAGGLVGTELVARSAPDGYTLQLATVATHAVIPALYKKVPYDPVKDFAAVAFAAAAPNALIVHPSLPAHSVKAFIALAKARPGQLNYASSGMGGAQHLAAELFRIAAGNLAMEHIAYKGTTPAATALVAGEVHWMIPSLSSALPHMATRKVRALGIASRKRMAEFPDVAAVAETIPGFESSSWWGMVAPEATPAAIISQLNAEVNKVLVLPETTKRLTSMGLSAMPASPQQFGAYIRTEVAQWAKVVRDAKITLE